jgi:hypothetical protein
MLYIWGDDHIRTLLRCRYALISGWRQEQDKKEGSGIMFHGNFWCNIEMNMETGQLEEHESRIRTPEELYQMTDPEWMYENLIDDLALQMYLFKLGRIIDIDTKQLEKLAAYLGTGFDPEAGDLRDEVGKLLDQYAYAATQYILEKTRACATNHDKKLMVLLFDPYGAMRQLLDEEPRKDGQIIEFLSKKGFNYFDMNLVHLEDYQKFNLSIEDYYDRYFIGHYNPHGNHFFAYSLKPRIVEWLDPMPFTYQPGDQPSIDFEGYLEGL